MDNTQNLSRTQLHENAMICFYQYLLFNTIKKECRNSINEIVENVMDCNFEQCPDFFKEIFFEAIKNRKENEILVSKYLNKTWKFERLSLIEQAILLLFTSEIVTKQCNVGVAIDVAVELAKKYCDDGTYRYINAILDKIGKENGE